MIAEQSVLRQAEDLTYQSLGQGQDTVILSLSSGQLYTCNETAAQFLSAVDGSRTFAQIVQLLGEEFEVSLEQLRNDLKNLAEELIGEKLLLVVQ